MIEKSRRLLLCFEFCWLVVLDPCGHRRGQKHRLVANFHILRVLSESNPGVLLRISDSKGLSRTCEGGELTKNHFIFQGFFLLLFRTQPGGSTKNLSDSYRVLLRTF